MSIDKALEFAVASVEMEGYKADEQCLEWSKKALNGEISTEQYIQLVLQKAGVIE